ncbi:MAG: hypothetical protein M3314_05000 [Actinomycetota bacterium]|nr:hypothetical protein [Actinomycetota bacterium]
MSGLLAGADVWRGTIRAIRWSPILATPLAASSTLVALRLIAGPAAAGRLQVVEELGLAFTAVAVAFLADDVTSEASPAVPVEAPARLRLRLAVGVPAVAMGWLLVLAVSDRVIPGGLLDHASGSAVASVGLAATALAMAVVARRTRAAVSPGAVGVASVATVGLASLAVPTAWIEALPPPEAAWPVLIALALLTIAVAGREPSPV